MTTLREAAQQVLEVLNEVTGWEWHGPQRVMDEVEDAVAALRAALEQPEQEPVAWMHTMIDDNVITHRPADLDRHPDRWTPLYKNPTPCETCQALARTVMMDQTAHDTHPPRREWQSLTDAQIAEINMDCALVTPSDIYFARAIEAALKEKNT